VTCNRNDAECGYSAASLARPLDQSDGTKFDNVLRDMGSYQIRANVSAIAERLVLPTKKLRLWLEAASNMVRNWYKVNT
jgi:hypothetical protein